MDDATVSGRTGVRRRRHRSRDGRPSSVRWPPPRCSRAGADVGPDDLVALSPDEAGRLAADLAGVAAGGAPRHASPSSSAPTPPHRYPLAALLPLPPRCPSTTPGVAPSSGRWPGDAAAAALGARRGRRRSRPRRGARRGRRRAHGAGGRPAVPVVGRTGDDDGRAARQRRRRETPTDETVFRDGEADPQVLRPSRRRRRPSAPTWWWSTSPSRSPSASSTARTAAWSPARRWSCRSARPSSSRSSCSTTRRRSRSPAARAHASPSPTWQPFPAVTMTCTARYGEELAPERRLGLQLLRDGQVVAVAWRTIVAVGHADRVAGATVPERRDVALLDLDPLLGDAAAGPGRLGLPRRRRQHDLRLDGVRRRPGRARPRPAEHQHARRRRRRVRDRDPAVDPVLRRPGARTTSAWRDGPGGSARAVPEGIQDALRAVVEAPGRTSAPAVLLLTEELTCPWELAVPRPRR